MGRGFTEVDATGREGGVGALGFGLVSVSNSEPSSSSSSRTAWTGCALALMCSELGIVSRTGFLTGDADSDGVGAAVQSDKQTPKECEINTHESWKDG